MPAQTVIKLRRDTAANWGTVNPVLAAGEAGFESDTGKLKIGDGVTAWASLGYVSGGASVEVSDTPPSAPEANTLWWESDTGTLFIYYDNFWVEAVTGVVGPQGPVGDTGDPGIVAQPDAPTNTAVLWLDTDEPGDAVLPTGGTAGQVLAKIDSADYNTEWTTLTATDISDLTASAAAINTIDDGTAGYTALSNGTAGISYQPVSHNYIINGAFDFWQRGTSQTSTGFGSADRWYHSIGGTTTVSRSTDIPTGIGVQYSSKWETGASSSFGQFYTALERDDVIPMRGKQMTFSFYVKSAGSMVGNLAPTVTYSNSTDALVSVTTAVSATGDTSFAASTVTEWTRKQIVFTVPSDAVGLRLQVLPDTVQASGVSCLLTGVQLEAGSVATPFKRHAPSLQGELAACQRYYASVGGGLVGRFFNYSASNANVTIPSLLPTSMRAIPTMTASVDVNDGSPITPTAIFLNNTSHFFVQQNNVPSGQFVDLREFTASAEL